MLIHIATDLSIIATDFSVTIYLFSCSVIFRPKMFDLDSILQEVLFYSWAWQKKIMGNTLNILLYSGVANLKLAC